MIAPHSPVANDAQGRAVIECRVVRQTKLRGCVIVSEAPLNANVGSFALQLVRSYRLPPGDRRVQNGKFRVSLQFKLPGGK